MSFMIFNHYTAKYESVSEVFTSMHVQLKEDLKRFNKPQHQYLYIKEAYILEIRRKNYFTLKINQLLELDKIADEMRKKAPSYYDENESKWQVGLYKSALEYLETYIKILKTEMKFYENNFNIDNNLILSEEEMQKILKLDKKEPDEFIPMNIKKIEKLGWYDEENNQYYWDNSIQQLVNTLMYFKNGKKCIENFYIEKFKEIILSRFIVKNIKIEKLNLDKCFQRANNKYGKENINLNIQPHLDDLEKSFKILFERVSQDN